MPRSRTPSRGRTAANAKKSPSRARSRSRSRSRARTVGAVGASPSRSPACARVAKSPARRPAPAAAAAPIVTARSPIRVTRSRSPARVTAPPSPPAPYRELTPSPPPPPPPPPPPKEPAPATQPPEPAPATEPTPVAVPVPIVEEPVILTSTPKHEARARRSISRQAPEENPVPPAHIIGSRHSARIANKLRELGIDPSAGGDSNSTTDAAPEENHVGTKPANSNAVSWKRALATPLVLLFALVPFYLYSACNKKVCSIARVPELPKTMRAYLDPVSLAAVPVWLILQLLLAKLPVGPLVEGQISKLGLQRYRCNGILTLSLTLTGAGVAFYLGLPVFDVLRKIRLLLVASAAGAILISLLLHLRSRRAHLLDLNPTGDTDSLLVNIINGRELSPKVFGIDLKLLLVRSSVAALGLFTMLYVLYERQAGQDTPTLIAAAGMISVVVLDRMWFEDTLLTTYVFMNEGLGLARLLAGMMMPFMSLFYLRFITVTGVSQPWYVILACCLLFAVGYLIQRSASSQKNEFRKNPVNPALAHLETIPTTKGKKLLVSGWWSVVRHPNHLGVIMMVAATTLLLGFNFALAWVQFPLLLIGTVRRCRQLDTHCQYKYGAAWHRYTDRVRHSLAPGVF